MSKVSLDAKILTVDGETRITIEKAKEAAAIDRRTTCFKGKGALSKKDLARSMWLSKEKKKEEYI